MDMGMGGMGMDMGGGMDMSSSGMFRIYNQQLARDYWYIIAGLVGFIMLLRVFEYFELRSRLRLSRSRSVTYPTRPRNPATQIYATATAIGREMSYPQLHLEGRFSWLSPPPLGRVILLLCYWAVITFMLCDRAVISDAMYYERIGFRGAWVTVTQVPLVYLLASKSSIIIHLVGSSHERLNWLHRWVSRTLLVTATVHGGFFMREWTRAGFVKMELGMMPMVKYGMGAWAVLVWTFLSSLSPLRRLAYEVFVLQHIAAAGVFLWLLWVHVPKYASYNVWFAVAAISLDWILRGALFVYRNFLVRLVGRLVGHAYDDTQRIGYRAVIQTRCKDITVVNIQDVPLCWQPGQHLYLWIPRLGPLEAHPFTIATPYITPNERHCNEIQFAIRAQSGFSKRIHSYAEKMEREDRMASLTAFVAGPYGAPPNWDAYETLILISASTGASFTLPILESILHRSDSTCVQRISFLLVVRERSHIEFYVQRLSEALVYAETVGIALNVEIAITRDQSSEKNSITSWSEGTDSEKLEEQHLDCKDIIGKPHPQAYAVARPNSLSASNSISEKGSCCKVEQQKTDGVVVSNVDISQGSSCNIVYSVNRPNILEFIRRPIEATGGETTVSVCGGKCLVAAVRNSVARLSDERAVHKGTGANGIHLHVEEYVF